MAKPPYTTDVASHIFDVLVLIRVLSDASEQQIGET